MKNNVKVSIIIPMYNAQTTITQTLASIKQQSFKDFEVIVVNDGSTDNSEVIAREFLANTTLQFQVVTQHNQGLSIARNNGIAKASGEYIWMLDADDSVNIDYLKNMLLVSQNSDVVVADIIYKYAKKQVQKPQNIFNRKVIYDDDKEFMKAYMLINPMAPNKLFKKEIFQKHAFTRGVIFEDVLFWYEIIDAVTSISFSPNSTYLYEIQDISLSNAIDTRYDDLYYNWLKIINFHKQQNTFEKYFPLLNYGAHKYLRDAMMRKYTKILAYRDLKARYKIINNFIIKHFGHSRKNLLPLINLKQLYIATASFFNVQILWLMRNYRYLLAICKHKFFKIIFNEKKYFSLLEQNKYREIFIREEIPKYTNIPKPYFNEKYESMFYGIGRFLQDFSIDKDKVFIEHGYNFSNVVTENYSALSGQYLMTTTKARQQALMKRYGNKVLAIGPYIQYQNNYFSEQEEALLKKQYGKILLVFPSHSANNYHAKYDQKNFNTEIKRIKTKYKIDSVFVCLYYKDLLNNNYEAYLEHEIVSAGYIYDIYNLAKLKSLLSISTYTMSNEIGSHIPYAFYMNKPHYLYFDKINYEGSLADTTSLRMQSYKQNEYLIYKDIFQGEEFVNYQDKKTLIDNHFNLNATLTQKLIDELEASDAL